MPDSGRESCEFALMLALLRLSLLRRDRQGDNVAGIDRHFLTHRRTISSYRIGEKPNATGAANEVPGNGERLSRVTGGQSQPDSLAPIDDIDYHIAETLILDLNRRRFCRRRRRFTRAARTGSCRCEHHDQRGSNEKRHGRCE
jgi:hypothetical protein